MKNNLEIQCVDKGSFSDITFELDEGIKLRAHRAMLISRCEVMRAMLNGQFLEAHAHIVGSCLKCKKNLIHSDVSYNFRYAFLELQNTHSTNFYATFTLMKFQIYHPKNA